MGGLSWWHWLIVVGVLVVLFGAKRMPDAARGLGRSLRILKSEVATMGQDDTPSKPAALPTVSTATPPVSPEPRVRTSNAA